MSRGGMDGMKAVVKLYSVTNAISPASSCPVSVSHLHGYFVCFVFYSLSPFLPPLSFSAPLKFRMLADGSVGAGESGNQHIHEYEV